MLTQSIPWFAYTSKPMRSSRERGAAVLRRSVGTCTLLHTHAANAGQKLLSLDSGEASRGGPFFFLRGFSADICVRKYKTNSEQEKSAASNKPWIWNGWFEP